MRTLVTLASGIFLSALMVATVSAGPVAAGNSQKKQPVVGKQKASTAPKKAVLSKRNRAKIEVEEQRKNRQRLRAEAAK